MESSNINYDIKDSQSKPMSIYYENEYDTSLNLTSVELMDKTLAPLRKAYRRYQPHPKDHVL